MRRGSLDKNGTFEPPRAVIRSKTEGKGPTARFITPLARQLGLSSKNGGDISTLEELTRILVGKPSDGGQPTLIVLDSWNIILDHPQFRVGAVALLDSLLRCRDLCLLVTSERSVDDMLQTPQSLGCGEISYPSLLRDVNEKIVLLHPLDDKSATRMLVNYISSRELMLAEMGIQGDEYSCHNDLYKAAFRALGENKWVRWTQALPGRIVELGKLLEKKRLDELSTKDVQNPNQAAFGETTALEDTLRRPSQANGCKGVRCGRCANLWARISFAHAGRENPRDYVIPWKNLQPFLQKFVSEWTMANGRNFRMLDNDEFTFLRRMMRASSERHVVDFRMYSNFCRKWWEKTLMTLIIIATEFQCSNPKKIWLVSRKHAEQLLKGHETGTFLVRLSERHPGKLAISYNDVISIRGGRIKETISHTLISVSKRDGFRVDKSWRLYDSFWELLKYCKKLTSVIHNDNLAVCMSKEEAFQNEIFGSVVSSRSLHICR